MKKLSIAAAALLAAALFFGCSNSSSSPALPVPGGSSSEAALPKFVGLNPLSGKTYEITGKVRSFDVSTYTEYYTIEIPAVSGESDAGEDIVETVYAYSCNNETCRLYSLMKERKEYVSRGTGKTPVPDIEDASFDTDEEFVSAMAKKIKPVYNLLGEEELKVEARKRRYRTFGAYGYTNNSSDEPVSETVIKRYNEMKKRRCRRLVSAQSYDAGDGFAKFNADDEYFPSSVKSLGAVYNNYSSRCEVYVGDESVPKAFGYSGNIYFQPDCETVLGSSGFVCSSVSGNTVKFLKSGDYSAASRMYIYGENDSKTFKGTTNRSDGSLAVHLKESESDGVFCSVIIKYASAYNNNAESGDIWTEVVY